MITLRITRGILLGAALFAPALALAQPPGPPDGDGPRPVRGRRGGPGGGQGEDGPRPPGPPIIAALDSNRDGELSAEEIRSAAAALKTLDHNRDGVLDRSELEPRGDGPNGPDGPSGGPTQGRRVGDPPPEGDDGPPGRGVAMGFGRVRPGLGNVLPPFVREGLSLTGRQQKQIAELETQVKGKLESILTAAQIRRVHELFERGPGGPRGPGGSNGPGGPQGVGGDNDGGGPPIRPRRPQSP